MTFDAAAEADDQFQPIAEQDRVQHRGVFCDAIERHGGRFEQAHAFVVKVVAQRRFAQTIDHLARFEQQLLLLGRVLPVADGEQHFEQILIDRRHLVGKSVVRRNQSGACLETDLIQIRDRFAQHRQRAF